MFLTGVQYFGTGTRYGLDILHQCDKMVKTKSQIVLAVNSNVCKKSWKIKLKNIG